jgi:hypothetical protein
MLVFSRVPHEDASAGCLVITWLFLAFAHLLLSRPCAAFGNMQHTGILDALIAGPSVDHLLPCPVAVSHVLVDAGAEFATSTEAVYWHSPELLIESADTAFKLR